MPEKETKEPRIEQQSVEQGAENVTLENLESTSGISTEQANQEAQLAVDTPNQEAAVTNHPDDFYQQVLGSFKRKEFSEEEIDQRQKEWQRYEGIEDKQKERRRVNDFPDYFLLGFGFGYLLIS